MSEQKTQDNVIMLSNVRAAFLSIFEPSQVAGEGKPAFSGAFIMTPDHPDIQKCKDAIEAVARGKWGEKAPDILKALIAGDKVCLHNGDLKSNYDGFAGNQYVSARSPARPLVIAQDRTPLTASDGKPYAGCYVNAQVAIWAQDNNYGKRINAQLRGVQFFRDGDAFGGGGVARAEEFDTVDASADGDAPTGDAWGDSSYDPAAEFG